MNVLFQKDVVLEGLSVTSKNAGARKLLQANRDGLITGFVSPYDYPDFNLDSMDSDMLSFFLFLNVLDKEKDVVIDRVVVKNPYDFAFTFNSDVEGIQDLIRELGI